MPWLRQRAISAFGVDLVAGANDPLGQFRPHALHLAQFAGGGRQHRRRIAEVVQQSAANSRPNAIDQGKSHRIDQIGIVVGHEGGRKRFFWGNQESRDVPATPCQGSESEYSAGWPARQAVQSTHHAPRDKKAFHGAQAALTGLKPQADCT